MAKDQFRNKFRYYLRRSGYNQRELAHELNVDASTLSKWVSGDNPWPVDALTTVSELLELDQGEEQELSALAGLSPPTSPSLPTDDGDNDNDIDRVFGSQEIITVYAENSRIEARGDIKFVGKETTYINERPLTSVEEDRRAAEFALQDLAKGVEIFVRNLQAASIRIPENSGPYRGLLNYDLCHANLFFGRAQVIKELMRHLVRHNLTVLHAASGAGKSSLLKAGISPRLIDAGHLPIYVRANQNPILALKRALLPNVDQIPQLLTTSLRFFFGRFATAAT